MRPLGSNYGEMVSWRQSPHSKTSAFLRKATGSLLSLPTMGIYREKAAVCKPRRVFTRNWPCWHPDLGLPSLQNCEKINFYCISHPVNSILLWRHEQTITAENVPPHWKEIIKIWWFGNEAMNEYVFWEKSKVGKCFYTHWLRGILWSGMSEIQEILTTDSH